MNASSPFYSEGEGQDDAPADLSEKASDSQQETVAEASDLHQEKSESSEQKVAEEPGREESKPDDGSLNLEEIKDNNNEENFSTDTEYSQQDSAKNESMLPAACKLDANKLSFKPKRRSSLWRDTELADIVIDCDGEDLTGSLDQDEIGGTPKTLREIWDESRNNFGGVLLGLPFGQSMDIQKERRLRQMWESSRNSLDLDGYSIHSSSSSGSKSSAMKMQKPKRFRLFGNAKTSENPMKESWSLGMSRREFIIISGVTLMTCASVTFLVLVLGEGTEVVTQMLKGD